MVDNVEVIDCKKLDIENEDLLFMIFGLYTSVFSCFGKNLITKNMALLVLYSFQDISFFKSEKSDNIKFHIQASFVNKKILVLLNWLPAKLLPAKLASLYC